MSTPPIVPPNPPPERPFGPAWRVLLAVALLATTGVLLAFWPALRALGAALVPLSGALAWLLLLFAAGVLVAALWALVAWALRLTAQARQAAIVVLPGGLPAHVADVKRREQRPTLADEWHWTMAAHYGIGLKEAERALPNLTSQNLHIHNATPPPQLPEAQPPQLPALPGGAGGTLAQLHSAGHVCRSGNSLLVGYGDGQPQYIELPECGFIGIGGSARSGKTTEALLLIEQSILARWHVFIADPHIHKADGLLNRCLPFSGRLARQAVTPDEIVSMIRLVDKIGRRRVEGDTDRTPVILVIDEFTNLVWRQVLPDDVLRILPSMAIEYAGVGVHGIIISHDYSRAGLGSELGAALRRSFTHRIAKRMDAGNVEFLLPKGSAAQARQVTGLETSQGLYHGPEGAQLITVPWLTETDAQYAAQGTPARPYAPRQPQIGAAPAPALAPTVPIAPVVRQSVPPTANMQITVPEMILDLLAARGGYMTASEIAAALRIDLQVARTETSALASAGQLARRQCTGRRTKERYEYSVESTHKPINQSTALSA